MIQVLVAVEVLIQLVVLEMGVAVGVAKSLVAHQELLRHWLQEQLEVCLPLVAWV